MDVAHFGSSHTDAVAMVITCKKTTDRIQVGVAVPLEEAHGASSYSIAEPITEKKRRKTTNKSISFFR